MDLEARWYGLSMHGSREAAAEGWSRIQQHYTEPVRAYHNLEHLDELFRWADSLDGELQRPELVHWAIYFHDIIYLPGSGNNEDLSADVAEQLLPNLGVEAADVATIATWIRATKSHSLSPEATIPDAELFLDMDLAVLGARTRRYQRYAQQVREEYREFSDLLYKPGRRKVLEHFLAKDRIFQSEILHQLLDAQARKNLRWELESL